MVKLIQALISKFFTQFLQAFLNLIMKEGSTTVIQIVQDLNNMNIPNDEKRKLAFERLKIAFGEIRDSSLSLAIEIAVKILKGDRTV